MQDVERLVVETARRARAASRRLAVTGGGVRRFALEAMADGLEARAAEVLEANAMDVSEARAAGQSAAFVDRLNLDRRRLSGMAGALRELAAQPDPLGLTEAAWVRPNGLEIARVRVPIGVVAILYESRPDVTSDAAGLCVKSGNACILRGGSEAARSNAAIADVLGDRGVSAGLPEDFVQVVLDRERQALPILLRQERDVDLVIPRGGEGLIRLVVEQSRIPVIKQYKGVCHTYVHHDAELPTALAICENAKCQRPATCNAMETLLVDRAAAERFLPAVARRMLARGVVLHGCPETCRLVPGALPATEETWDTEYLDLALSVRVVNGLDAALEHIARHGTGHSEAILTTSYETAQRFLREVDAAAVYVNASTRLTDGGQFGLGAEIGISTQKLHARGPMGAADLTTYKYVIRGSGQLRE
ncbi:MAG: glutamate-5-semialdehyde dehydrogenase [Candidatus Riflebacteria bacterium]|nr:glutamate-5-semialdehyde dehydrogenase [Candidatus Riflebacteria bacterium]